MAHPILRVKRLRPDAMVPAYMSAGASGLDLAAAIDAPIRLAPGRRIAVPTGLAIAVPAGYEGQVRARSGLALRAGVTVLNAPGTIDADYRGELQVLLVNLDDRDAVIEPGQRIAQLVIAPVARAAVETVDALDATQRGAGGFGSTGSGGRR